MGPDLYIRDWLSRKNHHENKDEEITDRNINIDGIDVRKEILACMTIKEKQDGTEHDEEL